MELTDNLVAYYKLDESSGNASDSVGNITASNSSVTYVSGKINNGASFNRSAYLSLGTPSTLNFQGAMTISFWMYTSPTELYTMLIADATSSAANGVYIIYTHPTRVIGFGWGNGSTATSRETNNDAYTINTWTHITVTRDSSKNQKIYVNGVEASYSQTENTSTPIYGTLQGLAIGRKGSSSYNYYTGLLDEVGFWSRALSKDEISQLYNSGAGLSYPFSTPNTSAFFNLF